MTSRLLTFRLGSPVIGITETWWRPVGEPAGGYELGKVDRRSGRVPSTTGPIVLEMIRGPAAMVIGWYQMFSGKALTAPVPFEEAVEGIATGTVEVARPDRKELSIGDGQAHLVAVAEAWRRLADWPPPGCLTPDR